MLALMRDSFVQLEEADAHDAQTAHKQDSSRNSSDLADLTRVVFEQVLASFTKPLNVVPISLHLVKTLEHFPTAPTVKDKETQA